MHIPDGFLDTKTILATSALSMLGLGRAFRTVGKQVSGRTIPLMGLSAAFIFAAQMLNFPVAGGTSGHLIGAVLAAVLLGPGAAIIVMTVVLVVQCFLFADGGVLALGANIFNMAIIAPVGGYYLYRGMSALVPTRLGRLAAMAFASWGSIVLAAVCASGELAWSGTVHWSFGFPAMTGIHMLIGLGEGIITLLVLTAIQSTRPELLNDAGGHRLSQPASAGFDRWIYGALALVGLALFVSPFASPWPDGLESVASRFGFESRAVTKPLVDSPFADYQVPGMGAMPAATMLAGLIGVGAALALSFILARILMKRSEGAEKEKI